MTKCRKCGFELTADVRFCPNCATRVDAPAALSGAFTGTISGAGTVFTPEQAGSATDLESGKEFHGRYTIEQKLGQGAMGTVYLAGDKLTSRRVALKLINPTLLNHASSRERFIREGLIARDIRHKNVVAVYDVAETEGQYYLVMEYLNGETLRHWLHRVLQTGSDVPFEIAEKIVRNILEGLGAAHETGVIHRDVKPENIMLTGNTQAGDYSLKILDFGIARAIDSAAVVTTSTSTGTALYMAPEQKTAADTVGPSADLYAVTVIFYELLLGVAPSGRYTPLLKEREDLPPGIDTVVDKGLSGRPRSRYQNVQEYLRALHEVRNLPSSSTATVDRIQHPPATSAAAKPRSFASTQQAIGPQIIAATGRLKTELLVSTNASPQGLYEAAWQALQACSVNALQNAPQTRTISGATGLSLRSFGQNISASIEEVAGGSTVSIVGQTKGPAVMDLGRGREEIHAIAGMLIQKLAASGCKAQIAREIRQSPPGWLVALILLGWFLLFIIIISMSVAIDNM
jgi:serine/threonine protein kinase